MDKRIDFMGKKVMPYTGYSQEREDELDQIDLKLFRAVYGDPNMSVQQMKEINNRPRPNTINVTFLKKK